MALHESFPWTVVVEKVGEDDEPFILRTVVGQNLGGGVEVASVTTGSYTDAQEAAHAQLLASAPTLLTHLQLLLDQVDYLRGACTVTEQVGAVLPAQVITSCRNAIALATVVPKP